MMKIRVILSLILVVILFTIVPCTVQAKIVDISAGTTRVLALDDKGNVWVWGDGAPPGEAWKLPIDNITAIPAGASCNYTLKSDGTVWAWGLGNLGGLGNGETGIQPTPVQVTDLTEVKAIATSGNTGYALKRDGTVWAWGLNRDGDLGIGLYGTPFFVSHPVQVFGLTDIVALGDNGKYAIKGDGTVYAWGDNAFMGNPDTGYVAYGALGDASRAGEQPVPFQVPGVDNVKQIGSGSEYTVYLKKDGTVWGWGANQAGELGDGTQTQVCLPNGTWVEEEYILPPVQAKITDVKQIAVAVLHIVDALKNDGTVWEWGESVIAAKYGGVSAVMSPTQLSGLDHVVKVSMGLALKDDGTVWGWGSNWGKKIKDDSEDRLIAQPLMIFKEPEPAATPSPTQSPTLSPTPTISPSNTTVPTENPRGTPLVTPEPSCIAQPTATSTPSQNDNGWVLPIVGAAGLVMAAGAVVYFWITKRL